jgi:hypothetical protein
VYKRSVDLLGVYFVMMLQWLQLGRHEQVAETWAMHPVSPQLLALRDRLRLVSFAAREQRRLAEIEHLSSDDDEDEDEDDEEPGFDTDEEHISADEDSSSFASSSSSDGDEGGEDARKRAQAREQRRMQETFHIRESDSPRTRDRKLKRLAEMSREERHAMQDLDARRLEEDDSDILRAVANAVSGRRGREGAGALANVADDQKQAALRMNEEEEVCEDQEAPQDRGRLWTWQPANFAEGLLPMCNAIFWHYERDHHLYKLFPHRPFAGQFGTREQVAAARERFMAWMREDMFPMEPPESTMTRTYDMWAQSLVPLGAHVHSLRVKGSRAERHRPMELIFDHLGAECRQRLQELCAITATDLVKHGEDNWMFPYFVFQLWHDCVADFTVHNVVRGPASDMDIARKSKGGDDTYEQQRYNFAKDCFMASSDYITLREREERLTTPRGFGMYPRDPIIVEINRKYYLHVASATRDPKIGAVWWDLPDPNDLIGAVVCWCMAVAAANGGRLGNVVAGKGKSMWVDKELVVAPFKHFLTQQPADPSS